MEVPRSVVVLTIDGLSASMLGPYANTWYSTDQFDRLAAQSLLCEFAYTDSSTLLSSLGSMMNSRPVFFDVVDTTGRKIENELIQLTSKIGLESIFFTDDESVVSSELISQFDSAICNPSHNIQRAAGSPTETGLANFFAAAIEQVAKVSPGTLLWLHSCGLSGPWDAPYAMREQFADEDDPPPPSFVTAPSLIFESEADPDELLGYQQACAAQIVLIDQFLGVMLDQLDDLDSEVRPLFVLTSPRGYPLGAHGMVGNMELSMHEETLHVPLMAMWPNRTHQLERNQKLFYANAVNSIISDWLQPEVDFEALESTLPDRTHEAIFSGSESNWSLRTHAWKLKKSSNQKQLFVKPDDRHEANDVADKCRLISDQLETLGEAFIAQIKESGSYHFDELPEDLYEVQD